MKQIKPTEAELEILALIWQYGPSNVRFINDQLNKKREVGYTTTLKIMQIMAEKELLKRDTSARTHIYDSMVSQTKMQKHLLKRFVDSAYRGSAMDLVMQALGNHKATKEELAEIKSLIKEIEKKK